MRLFACLVICAWSALGAPDASVIQKIPLRFEQDSSHGWGARSLGFGVGVNRNGAAIVLGQEIVEVQFAGGDPNAGFVGEKKSAAASNYFIKDGSHSRDAFLRLRRTAVYPGV